MFNTKVYSFGEGRKRYVAATTLLSVKTVGASIINVGETAEKTALVPLGLSSNSRFHESLHGCL
jgi:hypothetical protein